MKINLLMLFFKKLIISFIYLLVGLNLGILPFLGIDLAFFYTWGDVDFIWGMLLAVIFSLILGGFIMFFDILIIRFLFKKEFSNLIYLVVWFIIGCAYYWFVNSLS